MLVELVANVDDVLGKRSQLLQDRALATDIKATRESLSKLNAALEQLAYQASFLVPRLDQDVAEQIAGQAVALLEQLEASEREFSRVRRQAKSLDQLSTQVRDLQRTLEREWIGYISAEHLRLKDQYRLVEHLPEMVAQKGDIDRHLQIVWQFARGAPLNMADMKALDRAVDRLRELLLSSTSLPMEVQAFLGDVASGTCTLADLTDEILAWCRQQERARVFKITY